MQFQKQIATYQKVVSHVWDIVSKAREEWEVESSSRGGAQQNSSIADTNLLVAAVGMGKGLKVVKYNTLILKHDTVVFRWDLVQMASLIPLLEE